MLIVCHAWDDSESPLQNSGLFMPFASQAGTAADDVRFQGLLEAVAANRKAQTIRAMPSKTDAEKEAMSDEWISLARSFSLGDPPDGASLPQLDQFFERGLDRFARNDLQLKGGAHSLKPMLANVEKVQSLKLERVEFRACKIGKDTKTLGHLKTLFGTRKILAPTARTFFIPTPVMTLDDFNSQFRRAHRGGHLLPPGPAGSSSNNPNDFTTAPPQ